MKTWDVIIVGGGIIGLSLAIELRRHGAHVLITDRTEPGREASHAAAGMLACCDPHLPTALQSLALASAKLYPEFVHELADESGEKIDFRTEGTIVIGDQGTPVCTPVAPLTPEQLQRLEPALAYGGSAFFLEEQSVDPREVMAALLKAAKHRSVEIASGAAVLEVSVEGGRATVRTERTHFSAAAVVNCAGAWAGQIAPLKFPTRPIKGQMLAVAAHGLLRHVIRAADVYLVPRSSGRVLIGTTLEDVGFDKRVDPGTLHHLHQAAANLVPEIGQARILEDWAGLRPGTPDELLLLGRTSIEGYFVAAGHYRDGILLAPITAKVMTDVIRGRTPEFDLTLFSPARFR